MDLVIAQASAVARFMPVIRKGVLSRVQPVETAAIRADPEYTSPVFVNSLDGVDAQAITRIALVLVALEAVPIIPVQAVAGAQPQKPQVILDDALYPSLKRFSIDG